MDKSAMIKYEADMAVIISRFGGNRRLAREYVLSRAKIMHCSIKTAAGIAASEPCLDVSASVDSEDHDSMKRHRAEDR